MRAVGVWSSDELDQPVGDAVRVDDLEKPFFEGAEVQRLDWVADGDDTFESLPVLVDVLDDESDLRVAEARRVGPVGDGADNDA